MHPRPPAQGCEQLRTFSSHFIRVSNSFLIIFGLTTFCPFFTRFQSFCTHFLSIFDHCQLFPNHTLHCNSPLLIPALFYPLPPIFKFSPLIFTNFFKFYPFSYVFVRLVTHIQSISPMSAHRRRFFQLRLYELPIFG